MAKRIKTRADAEALALSTLKKFKGGKLSLKNRIKLMEAERPEYEIAPEAFESQEIAKREAFGEDPSIVAARTEIEQSVADTMAEAAKVSESGSGLLATLSAINANKSQAYLGLAGQEAGLRSQKLGQLYRQNYAMIEEKDKAFEFNVAAPYAAKLGTLREQKVQRTENWMRAGEAVASLGVSAATAGFGG